MRRKIFELFRLMFHNETDCKGGDKVKADIGVVGLAVMGQNLALNIARKGYTVAVFNRTSKRTEDFMKRVKDERIIPSYSIEDFVESLKRPRKIILMVKAGKPVDDVIEKIAPHLDEGDLIIDGGNSHFKDTERRIEKLSKEGILFLGMGVSGGEYGALYGPSLMPGGSLEAYDMVKDILLEIAAKSDEGPCCDYMGDRSAGHFVKMTHNGIEYAIMESIAEVYDMMRKILGMSAEEIGEIFKEWNEGELNSFLVEITYKIMERIDEETGKPLVDVILDKAGHKGTGKWTSQTALDLGVPTPSLTMAMIARMISFYKGDRVELSKKFRKKRPAPPRSVESVLGDFEKALSFSMFMAFSQGLWLIKQASDEFGYGTDLSKVLKVWKNGCIIRAKMIDFIKSVVSDENPYLLKSDDAMSFLSERLESIVRTVKLAREYLVPTPALNASLDHFLSMTEENLPANLIQAQRDFFGAHTFERIDREGIFHVDWWGIEGVEA